MNRTDYYTRWLTFSIVFIWCCTNSIVASALEKTTNELALNDWNNAFCNLQLAIPDNSCTASSNFLFPISVANGTQLGIDVILKEVRLIVGHSWNADLDMSIISPSGVKVELSSDNGGGSDNYGLPIDATCQAYTAFSMNACQSILDADAPFEGNFLPEGDLSDFNDGSNPNGNWILQICDDAQNDIGILQYVELIFSSNICTPPTNYQIEPQDAQSLLINWQSTSNCVETILEYGAVGFTPGLDENPGMGTVVLLDCNDNASHLLDNLLELTAFDCYLREVCVNGFFSENTCVFNGATTCFTPALTSLSDFDDQTPCGTSCGTICPLTGIWKNSTSDQMDWLADRDGTVSSKTGPSDDISGGGNYLYIETSGSACQQNKQAILQSECMDIKSAEGSCHLSFYYHLYGFNVNQLSLSLSLDGGTTWSTLWSISGDQGDRWQRQYIDLGGFDGQVALFRFIAKSGAGFRGDIAIDEIAFYGPESLGDANNVFYADVDQDGFGDPENVLSICATFPPNQYVANALDCNDADPLIHPNATELPCNQIDENCNGMLDDLLLPNPQIQSTAVCSGSSTSLAVASAPYGQYYWYDAPMDGELVHLGAIWNTPSLTEGTTYYLQDSVFGSCASDRIPVVVTVNPLPSIFTLDLPVICEGTIFDLTSLVIQDANSTSGNLTFHHDTPTSLSNAIDPMVEPTETTTYFVRWETLEGCSDEIGVEIIVDAKPTGIINVLGATNICPTAKLELEAQELGTANGQVAITWDNGSTAATREVFGGIPNTTTVYSATFVDEKGCTDVSEVAVFTVESINSIGIVAIDAVETCGGNDGAIVLEMLNGIAPYEVSWQGPVSGVQSNVVDTFRLENIPQGTYQISIVDNAMEACEMTMPILIVNGPSAVIDTTIHITPSSCANASDGAIDIQVTGGNPIFQWSNGATSEDLTNLSAGLYSVTINDGNCINILEDIEVVEPQDLAIPTAFANGVSCLGGVDGSLELSITGGTAPYQLQWNNGMQKLNLTALTAGAYWLTITDANACQFISDTFQIVEPTAIEMNSQMIDSVSCFGLADGSIELLASGGTPPYFYKWSNGQVGAEIQGLEMGVYQVTVQDANGCTTVFQDFEVEQPAPLSLSNADLQNASCDGINDASIHVAFTGGVPPYTYQWSNGEQLPQLSGLAAGTYQITVTDSNQCAFISESFVLETPSVLKLDHFNITQVSCDGVDDGQIELEISGGQLPYTYHWNNGQNTEDLFNLGAGEYSLFVEDANGCTLETDIFSLSIVFAQTTTLELVDHISCHGATDGLIFTNPPSAEWSNYQWNNGMTSQDLQGLPAGAYFATVSTADGCFFITDTIHLLEPEALAIEVLSVEQINCADAADGSIDVTVDGGTAPYIYSWNNGGNQEDLANLSAGMYQLVVLDANGCILAGPAIEIVQAFDLEMVVDEIINVGCSGGEEGSIAIEVFGGQLPYQYLWSNGSTNQDIQNLIPGKYSLTLTDANECRTTLEELEVQQLTEALTLVPTQVNHPSCAFANNGTIAFEILGGTGPFQYNWSNGQTDSLSNDLAPGNYTLTVTDVNGCVGVSPLVAIESPELLTYQIHEVQSVFCEGQSSGSIDLWVGGGTAPYDYLWNNGATTQDIDQLPIGTYFVTIEDANACYLAISQGVVIDEANPLEIVGLATPSNNVTPIGVATVQVNNGQWPFTFEWDENTGGQTDSIAINLFPGSYEVTVTDAQSCSQTISVQVEMTTSTMAISSIDFLLYPNPSRGSIYLRLGTKAKVNAMFVYNINGQQIPVDFRELEHQELYQMDLNNQPAGLYWLKVSYDHQESLVKSFVIQQE